jgi:hypothetical protein
MWCEGGYRVARGTGEAAAVSSVLACFAASDSASSSAGVRLRCDLLAALVAFASREVASEL